MCRFSASLAPPPAPEAEGFEELLDAELASNDDFNWFDAIEAIDGGGLGGLGGLEGAAQASTSGTGAPALHAGTVGAEAVGDSSSVAPLKPAGSGSANSSTFDVLEMFRLKAEQQQAQEQAAAAANSAAAASAAQQQQQAAAAAAQQQAMMLAQQPAFAAAPFGAAVVMQQQPIMCGFGMPVFAAPLTPSSAFLPPEGAPAGAPLAAQFEASTGATAMAVNTASAGGATTAATSCGTVAGGSSCGGSAPHQGQHAATGRRSRASKTQEELDEAVERIKQKRRESAQRSRARKNDYMHTLELENAALRDELARMQQVVATLQRGYQQVQPHAALLPLGAL